MTGSPAPSTLPTRGRPKSRDVVALVAGLALSAIALLLVFANIDVQRSIDALRAASVGPLLLVLGCVAIQVLIRSARWRALVRASLAQHAVPIAAAVRATLIGYLGNVLLPSRLGELVRSIVLARRLDRPLEPIIGSVVIERAIDVASLGVVAIIAAAFTLGLDSAVVFAGAFAAVVACGGLVVLLGGARIMRRRRASESGQPAPAMAHEPTSDDARPVGWRARLAMIASRFVRGLARIPGRVIAFAAMVSVASWLLDGLSFWLIGISLDAGLGYAAALVLASVTVLGTALPSAPGYIGTFEVATVAAGIALGLSAESALAIGLLAHLLLVGPLAIGGAISLVIEGASGRRAIATASAR